MHNVIKNICLEHNQSSYQPAENHNTSSNIILRECQVKFQLIMLSSQKFTYNLHIHTKVTDLYLLPNSTSASKFLFLPYSSNTIILIYSFIN